MDLSARFCIALALLFAASCAFAETTPLRDMHSAKVEATIDGVLDEPVWQAATKVAINNEYFPGDNIQAPVTTTAYIYQDGSSLFVAVRAFDPNPEEIRAIYRSRDTIRVDDRVGIIIDTFDDQRGAYEFFLNPLGVQGDQIKDGVRKTLNRSWDAIWSGAGQIDDQGYTLEFQIPFSELRFPDGEAAMNWGIEFLRFRPRGSQNKYSSHPKERGNSCFLCQIPRYHGFENLSQTGGLQVTPSMVVSRIDSRELFEHPELTNYFDERQQGDVEVEPGLDVRWGITQDNVVNLTINPDFSQVSADSDQISINSSFSPSFSENRDFFLEGQDSFKTSRLNLVHTRRIASPNYGLKFTGKYHQHNYGVLIADDDHTHIVLPGSQGNEEIELDSGSKLAIGRYRLDVGRQSNIGIMLNQRSADDYKNTVASIDGVYQPSKEHKFTYQGAISETKNPESLRLGELINGNGEDCALTPYHYDCVQDSRILTEQETGSALSLQYKFIQPLYELNAFYGVLDDNFRADLGNIGKVGYEKVALGGSRKWYGRSGSPWTQWGVFGDWDQSIQEDGQKLEEESEIHFYINGPKRLYAEFELKDVESYWNGAMYDEFFYSLSVAFDPLKELRVWSEYRVGETIDKANSQPADEVRYELGGNWRIGSHVSAKAIFKYRTMDVAGGELFNVTQGDIRLNVQFNLAHSLRLVVKGTSIKKDESLYLESVLSKEDNISTQLIYGYEPNPKTLCYIGYSDASYEDEEVGSLIQKERSFFMKLSYAFQL